ncbi:MAG TPA: carbon-nitrogen hydrolase family protein [Planctomycetota bacterium]|nr:carbon-nitrogen hydrolase family protein [Planctomycetota bacterium]
MKLAVYQFAPRLADVAGNLDTILRQVTEVDADLVLFPECALTGYGFESAEEAVRVAEPIPGPSTELIAQACRDLDRWAIFGMLERDPATGALYNSAAVIGPGVVVGAYRKNHLPFLGVDRFAAKGDRGLPVFTTPFGKIGVLICYDLAFPEAARVLKLAGAQLLCVPTNWPEAASISCDYAPFVRAHENHIHVATANRVGEESGFRFLGRSRIIDCTGDLRAAAGDGKSLLTAELDLEQSLHSRKVIVPGRYEVDRIGHRRPELYGPVAEAGTETPPPASKGA